MSVVMGIIERLVPDELWELFQCVVPEAPSPPQGGGRRRHGVRGHVGLHVAGFPLTTRCPTSARTNCSASLGATAPAAEYLPRAWADVPVALARRASVE